MSDIPIPVPFAMPQEEEEENVVASLPDVDFAVTLQERSGPSIPLRCHMVDGLISNVLMSANAVRYLRDEYEASPQDVFIATFPKCGNTWTRKICMEITKHALPQEKLSPIYMSGKLGDDVGIPYFEKVLSGKVVRDVTVVKRGMEGGGEKKQQTEGLEEETGTKGCSPGEKPQQQEEEEKEKGVWCWKQFLHDTGAKTKLPRFWKTHLPASHFPRKLHEQSKMIIVQRDPKDCMVSAFHYYSSEPSRKRGAGFNGSFTEWHRLFMNGLMWYGSVWDWYTGMKALASQRPEGTVLWLHYEHMVKDPETAVRKIIAFLGFDERRYLDEVIADILQKISFKHCNSVKKEGTEIHMTGGVQTALFRKGKAGDWRNHMTMEQANECDMVTLVKFDGSGFPYVNEVRKEQRKGKYEEEVAMAMSVSVPPLPKRPEGVTREEFREESGTLDVFA